MNDVKDKNIGMGLACSKAILNEMGGSVGVKQSSNTLTIFEFKLPVIIAKNEEEEKVKYMVY